MNSSPSVDQMLEGVIRAVDDEILPALTNPKAYATAQMIQSLLQSVRQTLPVIDEQLVQEHNEMIRTLRDTAAALGDASGDAADRIRGRAATLGARSGLPAPFDRDAAFAAHDELGRAIETTFYDLDELQRAGIGSADAALQVVRAHLGPRFVRDAQTVVVGEGLVGRG